MAQSQGTTGGADPALYSATVAAGDPPNTNKILDEYQATSENLLELNVEKQAKTKA